ncbi:DUF4249 domain-containing protein [Seonamhaeicola algicola]|uniref:DUF4249 domain-containing protein n=1 Tax=Seonamhaeicola algicola TaxID=1719036 RepID=A0A5C7AKE2_9FLAO|nr:DUF4249 domain-containing protein [Seonamhaeicola algicola]
MKLKTYCKTIILCLLANVIYNCTEPFALVTESFEDVLVVEATITNELKNQEIKLSRTFKLEEGSVPVYETNANVSIITSVNETYTFSHIENGLYKSNQEFQAQEGVSYMLKIKDSKGDEYMSTDEFLPSSVAIEEINTKLINIEGELGVQVLVDSEDTSNDANYFRYEYEETYKIETELFYRYDIDLDNWKEQGTQPFCAGDPELIARPENQKTCYSTNYSNDIIVTSLNGLDESKVSEFPVRFIPVSSHVLRDRYSILVKQYIQSADANNFYKVLEELGGDKNLLTDNQPGFVKGNISLKDNDNKKVIGFFDVSSITTKRVFFDYSEFEIDKPEYIYNCDDLRTLNYAATDPNAENGRAYLFWLLSVKGYKYYGQDACDVFVVPPHCGDCSTFASNEKPIFWED